MTPEEEKRFREGTKKNLEGLLGFLREIGGEMVQANNSANGLEETLKSPGRPIRRAQPSSVPRATVIQKGDIEDVKLYSELGVDEFIRRM